MAVGFAFMVSCGTSQEPVVEVPADSTIVTVDTLIVVDTIAVQ